MVEIMKIRATSFKRSHAALLHSVPPTCSKPPPDPRLHQRLLDTHGQVWFGPVWGHCSFLLGPGVHKVLFVASKSPVSSVLCKLWWLYGGVNGALLQRAYAVARSAVPRALRQASADRTSAGDVFLAQSLWAGRVVPFPGLSRSGDQVLGERTVPGGPCTLITSQVPTTHFPGSWVCRLSPQES